jgi:hypothetical protein
MKNISEQ